MTITYQTITNFLSQTGLPVYLEGQVPDGATYPYVVYSLTLAPFGQSGACEVTGWFRGGDANARCAAFLDRLMALLPESGLLLSLPRARLVLYPTGVSTVRDKDAIGGQMTIETRLYAAREVT